MIQSNSKTPAITALKPVATPIPPTVFYTDEAWESLWYIINKSKKEVGWLGLVDIFDDGDYLITDIYIPPQEVDAANTDIAPEAMATLAMQIIDEGKDPSKLRYWGHSHVNMGVSPSHTDEKQVDEYLETADMFIRGIYNKRGESKVDVYDKNKNYIFQCVTNTVYTEPLTKQQEKEIDRLLKENVTELVPKIQAGGYNRSNNLNKKNQRVINAINTLEEDASDFNTDVLDIYDDDYDDIYGEVPAGQKYGVDYIFNDMGKIVYLTKGKS